MQWATDVIERQVQQLTRLVDDLLDVSRITRGKIELRMEPVDLAAVVARAVEISRPLIDAREHALDGVAAAEQPLRVEGDLTRLAQVVSNLLNNAAKYTEDGRPHRADRANQAGGEAVLRVRDTGIGIAAEMLPQIFEMFTQVDRSLAAARGRPGDRPDPGAAAWWRCTAAASTAHSDGPGHGSEFVVRLPALAEAAPPAAAEAEQSETLQGARPERPDRG